jgi:gas vesicle protein
MIEWIGILKALGAGIGAVSQARQLYVNVKSAKENRRLSTVLNELKEKAYKVSSDMDKELREITYQLQDLGIDTSKSINQLVQDLHWYNGITRMKLISIRSRLRSFHTTLADLLDEVPSILICSDLIKNEQEALLSAFRAQEEIDRVISYDTPISELLDHLANIAQSLKDELK